MKGASDRKLNLRGEEDKRDTTSFISICAGTHVGKRKATCCMYSPDVEFVLVS